MRAPTKADIEWVLARTPAISQITIAPELPGAFDFIAAASGAGIRMSAGHTEADGEVMQKAVAAGLKKVTHLFNAMSSASKKGLFASPVFWNMPWLRKACFANWLLMDFMLS